jgi:hypothetical protein
MRLRSFVLFAVFTLLGCAGVQLSGDKVAHTQESIRAAEAMGAGELRVSRPYLEAAKAEAMEAERLAAEGDARAPMMLARSEADAALAQDLVREASMHAKAVRAAEDLRAVRARPAP